MFVLGSNLSLDGLSIPFFSLSKNTTLSLTNTFNLLSATRSPDWLNNASTLEAKLPGSPLSPAQTTQAREVPETTGAGPASSQAGLAVSEGGVIIPLARPRATSGERPLAGQSLRSPVAE
jgi:hypothetical protein